MGPPTAPHSPPSGLFPLPSAHTLRHFSTLAGLGTLSLRSMWSTPPHKETLGDRISRIKKDSHMSSSSNWYSKLYTVRCHQERVKQSRAFLCIAAPLWETIPFQLRWIHVFSFYVYCCGKYCFFSPHARKGELLPIPEYCGTVFISHHTCCHIYYMFW